jgi:hypothetical protein
MNAVVPTITMIAKIIPIIDVIVICHGSLKNHKRTRSCVKAAEQFPAIAL